MNTIYRKTKYKAAAMIIAAAVAVTAAGCTGGAAGAADAEEDTEVVTVYVTNVDPAAGSEALGTDSSAEAAEADTAAPIESALAGTTSAAAEEQTALTTAASAEEAQTSRTAAAAASTAEESSAAAASDAAASDHTAFRGYTSAAPDEIPGEGETGAESASIYDENEDYDPSEEREEPDTELKESVLSSALRECTGWGQSAGSSLRAAYAAVQLLSWANQANAADVDAALLEGTVNAEFRRLSSEEQTAVRSNWSSVSYDVSMVLDDFDEIAYLLEDAGCKETAREAAADQNVLKNWKAVEKAVNAVLK